MFAALCRDVDAARFKNGLQRFEKRLADFGYGMAAEIAAERFARAATDNDNLACGQVRFFNEFFGGVLRVVTYLLDKVLVFNFVRYASH